MPMFRANGSIAEVLLANERTSPPGEGKPPVLDRNRTDPGPDLETPPTIGKDVAIASAAVFVDSKREKNDEPWFFDSWATRGALAAA